MVVLESGGMHTSPGNQYLQPDYLSPLPTTVCIITISTYTQIVNSETFSHLLVEQIAAFIKADVTNFTDI